VSIGRYLPRKYITINHIYMHLTPVTGTCSSHCLWYTIGPYADLSHDHVWHIRGGFLCLTPVIFFSVHIGPDGALEYQDRGYNAKAYHRRL